MIRIRMDHLVEERFQFQIGHRFIETGFYFFGQKFSNTPKQWIEKTSISKLFSKLLFFFTQS